MAEIFRFLKLAETYIYIILGIIGFLYIRKLIIAIGDYKNCLFGLEKDNARNHIFQAGGVLFLLLIVAVGEFSFLTFVNANPNVFVSLATPTVNYSSTETPIAEIAAVPQGTTNPSNLPAATSGAPTCEAGKLEWKYPLDGDEIKGKVELKATINFPDFGFYKYENSQDNINWNTMQAGKSPVTDGVIGVWDTSLQSPGDYYLRLVGYDNNQTALPACVIKVRIVPE